MSKGPIGLYLHVPFCDSKCPYCDFYSVRGTPEEKERYASALCDRLTEYSKRLNRKADTLYIGGGTPSVLSVSQLCELIKRAESAFLTDEPEVTVECNPSGLDGDFFKALRVCKVNRLSIGLQSADDRLRRALGRRASKAEVARVISSAQRAGIDNISLDVMLGIPGGAEKDLRETLDFCIEAGVPHVSAYLLQLEEGTVFYRRRDSLKLPDDDAAADMYLFMCAYLKEHGLSQYEISNFARPGFESRHNLKYWRCEEYLGLGPSAHSFLDEKRFCFPRDARAFVAGCGPVPDGRGGDYSEFAMLALRLNEGLTEQRSERRFGRPIPQELRRKASPFAEGGYLFCDERGIRLTPRGFLVSNAILAELL